VDPENAFYCYKEGKNPNHITTAVIKERKNIRVDLSKHESKNYIRNLLNIDWKGPKYKLGLFEEGRLVDAGPSMFLPLFSAQCDDKNLRCEVLGVIVLARSIGVNNDFTDYDFRVCLYLAGRLSKIILHSKFMSTISQTIKLTDLEGFVNVAGEICEISGAPGATLFRATHDNKLEAIASNSKDEIKDLSYDIPSESEVYGSDYKGFTLWVATQKKVLKFNNEEEMRKLKPVPLHSGMGKCEVSHTPPERFLGVPIVGMNEDLIGVLRTAKTSDDSPFTLNDEIIFSSLAIRLASFLDRINMEELLRIKQESEINKYFPEPLRECIFNAIKGKNDFISKEIKEFFKPEEKRDIELTDRIFKCISSLWKNSNILVDNKALNIFKFFDKEILAELPGYRDHFIHQFQVFLLGYCIIERLEECGLPFNENYKKSLENYSNPINDDAKIAWMFTSTFHDISFPLEKISKWLPNKLNGFLGEKTDNIIPQIPIQNIFFEDTHYLKSVNDLSDLFDKMGFTRLKKEFYMQKLLKLVYSEKDHGILSSLMLLISQYRKKEEIILPSALAISLHKRLGKKFHKKGQNIKYEEFPLFYLLYYCDVVHEWEREDIKENPVLEKIIVTTNIDELGTFKKNIPPEIEKKETIYVHAELYFPLKPERVNDKKRECENSFTFITSENPYFSIVINGEFLGSG